MDPEIVYSIQQGYAWDWKVALDLFFGGAGVGAFLFSVALFEFWGHRYRRIPQTAAFLAPVLILAGLLLLLLKLGRPHYLFQVVLNFSPTAPLWWGGLFQVLLVLGAGWYAYLWRNIDPNPVRRRLGLALTPIALLVGAYHGMLLSVLTSRPLWNSEPTIISAFLGFITTGIAIVMLVHVVRMKRRNRLSDEVHVQTFLDSLKPVRNLLAGALILQLGTYFLWWVSLRFGDAADRAALDSANAGFGAIMWIVGIGIGVVLPLLIGGLAVASDIRRRNPSGLVRALTVSSALILVGGLAFRIALVLAGQVNPVYVTLF